MSYAVATGLRTDCEELLRKFQATDSVRFDEFCKIWREMKFSLIIWNCLKDQLKLLFLEESLLVALSFCSPLHAFQHRTGGLYLLYAFYFKQPADTKVQIRITIQQWKDMLEFIDEAKKENHHDIHYVFQKLVYEKAFHFVACAREMAPLYKDVGTTEAENSYTLHSTLKEFADESNFLHLENIHQHYIAMKKTVMPSESSSIDENFMSSVMSLYNVFEAKRAAKLLGDKKEVVIDEKDSIGKRRSDLKSKSMKKAASSSRSRRHRSVDVEKSSKKSPKKKKSGKQSAVAEEAEFMDVLQVIPFEPKNASSGSDGDMPKLTIDD